jgi:hypothetical protein
MRRFHLQRNEAATGTSRGVRFAEGIVFSDGRCTLAWLTGYRPTATYPSLDLVQRLYGYATKSQIVFEDAA